MFACSLPTPVREVCPSPRHLGEQKAALDQLLHQNGPRDVPFVALPQLVGFLDINDKSTKMIVSPFDLSASFGPGVELSRVVLELTRGAITPAPQIWPQWLKVKGRKLGV